MWFGSSFSRIQFNEIGLFKIKFLFTLEQFNELALCLPKNHFVVIFARFRWRQNAEARAQLVLAEHLEEYPLKNLELKR